MPPAFVTPGAAASPFIGVQRIFQVPAPVPGAEFDLRLPSGAWYRLLYGRARFVTAAPVANRAPGIRITDDTDELWRAGTGVAITAGLTTVVNFASGIGGASTVLAGASINIPVPGVLIPAGYRIQSITPAIDAADQYDQIRLVVEEIDLGPNGNLLGAVEFGVPAEPTGE